VSAAYKKGATTPEQLPMVICMPLAKARFPYRGLLTAIQEKAMPVDTHRPRATIKQPVKLRPSPCVSVSMIR
jgi:hypothetical protein